MNILEPCCVWEMLASVAIQVCMGVYTAYCGTPGVHSDSAVAWVVDL